MKFIKIFSLYILLLTFSSVQSGDMENNSMTELYYLSVNAKNIHATVLLNEVPLVDLKDGSNIITEVPIGGWLIPGHNNLEILVKALPESDTILGEITVGVFQHDHTFDVPTAKKIYATLNFPNKDSNLKQLEERVGLDFEFNEKLSTKLWEDAQIINGLSEKDKSIIMELVNQLGDAVVTGDIDKAISLQQYKIKDDSLAEGSDPAEIQNVLKTNYSWLKSQEGIKLIPYRESEQTFSIMGKNKVVKITDNNYNEILRLESDELMFEIPVFVSRIDGNWLIVR
jgi:hypothetical protein